jgi:hypothetical protein
LKYLLSVSNGFQVILTLYLQNEKKVKILFEIARDFQFQRLFEILRRYTSLPQLTSTESIVHFFNLSYFKHFPDHQRGALSLISSNFYKVHFGQFQLIPLRKIDQILDSPELKLIFF